jgi:hypothetical protein
MSLMFTRDTRVPTTPAHQQPTFGVPTTPAHQQPTFEDVTCLSRDRAESVSPARSR